VNTPAAPEPLLQVSGLRAGYGAVEVLFGVDLALRPGEVLALMGRNGAGKSSLLKALIGLMPRASGRVRFEGRDILGLPSYRICRLGLGWVPEDRRIFTDLTVAENLQVGRRPARPGVPAWTEERLLRLFPNLAGMLDRPAARMSGGEQQMLTVARTLMGNPRLVLLDEPSEGVAPRIVEQMAATILALKQEGLAVLLSEQNLGFAAAVADRACVLDRGEVKLDAPMHELATSPALRRSLLAV
jgi:branched-chain amino acid transport system ATP-binding protein